jgi:hypothetical protein
MVLRARASMRAMASDVEMSAGFSGSGRCGVRGGNDMWGMAHLQLKGGEAGGSVYGIHDVELDKG